MGRIIVFGCRRNALLMLKTILSAPWKRQIKANVKGLCLTLHSLKFWALDGWQSYYFAIALLLSTFVRPFEWKCDSNELFSFFFKSDCIPFIATASEEKKFQCQICEMHFFDWVPRLSTFKFCFLIAPCSHNGAFLHPILPIQYSLYR